MFKNLRIFLILLLTGCQTHEEKTVNTLKINMQEGDLPSLHPHALMIYLRGLCIAKNLYEGLTRLDASGKPQLAGAQAVDISEDRLHYTFTLRDHTWSDGTSVTAQHYERAWKEALSPTSNCSRADLLYMLKNAKEAKMGKVPLSAVGVKAQDDKTLLVELSYPSPYFLELTSQPICFPLLLAQEKEPLAFNGPFVLENWKKGDFIRLKKNPHFWNHGNVALSQIDYYVVQDPSTVLSMYEKNEIDWIGAPLSYLSTEQVHDFKKKNRIISHPIDRAFWVFFNAQHPLLSSPSIRRALSIAIDRQAITEHILIGGAPLHKALPLPLLPLPIATPIEENLAHAQKLFQKGLQELGMTKETIPPLSISFSQQSNRKQVAQYLQQVWSQAFNIDVQLLNQEWNVLRTNLEKAEFEISGCYEAAFYKDPLELLEKFVEITANNFSKWTSPVFTETVARAKMQSNPDLRMQLLSQAEQILVQEMPFIPICSDTLIFDHRPELHGYTFDYVGAVDFSYASF